MRRRRFLPPRHPPLPRSLSHRSRAWSAAATRPGGEPLPVPPSDVVLRLPQDMYLHEGAPTEWWWHIGTLRAGERVFGFEINAASFEGQGFAFTQVMLSDVARDAPPAHDAVRTAGLLAERLGAERSVEGLVCTAGAADSKLNAFAVLEPGSGYTSSPRVEIVGGGGSGAVALATVDPATGRLANVVLVSAGTGYVGAEVRVVGGGGSGAVVRALHTYVAMEAPQGDPTHDIHVQALLVDDPTLTEVRFDLRFSQQGRPFFVWGTGINPGGSGHDLQTNNFYFSLTRLAASGTIELGGRRSPSRARRGWTTSTARSARPRTPSKWFLQDMQLDDGTCISNYSTVEDGLPALGERRPSTATIQDASGSIWYVPTFVTPIERTWTSPVSGETYFMKFRIEILSFDADLVVESLMDSQEFPVVGSPVYEGRRRRRDVPRAARPRNGVERAGSVSTASDRRVKRRRRASRTPARCAAALSDVRIRSMYACRRGVRSSSWFMFAQSSV